ncbi:MAG: hypothetical protein JWN43_4449 [Gammaproteobacteria bacterium]|nr:hypothetical protein [Gammaproteobacteria bacterium]
MYAFLIVFAITFPGCEGVVQHSFDIRSVQTFDQAACMVKAKETADYAAKFAQAKIPGAEFQIKLRCDLQESFPA